MERWMNDQSRRTFVKYALGLGLAPTLVGCASSHRADRTTTRDTTITSRPYGGVDDFQLPPELRDWEPSGGGPLSLNVGAISRSRWAKADPIPARMNALGSITRITVHHEGSSVVTFDSVAQTARRLESIRKGHLSRMTAGDIGYHFVIDRAGRVWEGRSLAYQGAHVKNHNRHNLGIMVLGNFERQAPTEAQLQTLARVVRTARSRFDVPLGAVYTHRELGPTACPGASLQRFMVSARSNGILA
jgi:hypothetical protein